MYIYTQVPASTSAFGAAATPSPGKFTHTSVYLPSIAICVFSTAIHVSSTVDVC